MKKWNFKPKLYAISGAEAFTEFSGLKIGFRTFSETYGLEVENNFARRLVASFNACRNIEIDILESPNFKEYATSSVTETEKQLLVSRSLETIAELDRLKTLLARCAPYVKELQSENYPDESVGIYEDTELTALHRAIRMQIEGITEQDVFDTMPDEPLVK